VPSPCSQRIGDPSPGCRQATAEYGTARGAQPDDCTVVVTEPPSRIGGDSVKEHGGGGGGGPCPVAWATPEPAPALTATAQAIQTKPGLFMDGV